MSSISLNQKVIINTLAMQFIVRVIGDTSNDLYDKMYCLFSFVLQVKY